MKKTNKKQTAFIFLVAFGLTVAAPAGVFAQGTAQGTPATEIVAVETTGNVTTVSGTVVPFKEVALAAQVPGQIKKVAGREGDRVSAGDELIVINDDAIQAQRRAAMASMYAAEAELRNAHVQYSRELLSPRSGKPTGMGLPSMMDSFMRPFSGQYAGPNDPWMRRYADLYGQANGLDGARSRLMQARAMIEQLDAKIRDARLIAPFDGVITKKAVEEGDTVQPGRLLMRVAHVKYLRIQAEVPVRLITSLSEKKEFKARIDVGRIIKVKARVAQVFPVADAARHTVTVKFDFKIADDNSTGIRPGPGAYAEVLIIDKHSGAAKLPTISRAALIRRGSLQAVEVLLPGGKRSLRLVRVGGPAGPGKVTILSGLKGGEKVVLHGAPIPVTRQAGGASNPVQ